MFPDIIDCIIINFDNIDDIIKYMLSSKKNYNNIITNNNLWNSICLKYFKQPGNFKCFKQFMSNKIRLNCISIDDSKCYKEFYDIQENKRLKIGRSRQNDICILRDPNVSRLHAEFKVINPSKIFIRDLGSFNKTFINDNVVSIIQKTQLYVGDEINVGGNIILKVAFI